MGEIVVNEGIQPQGIREEITWAVTFSGATTVAGPSVTVYDDAGDDVTATVMPTGSPSVSGNTVTLPKLKSLTADIIYRVILLATVDGQVRAAVFDVAAKDEKTI